MAVTDSICSVQDPPAEQAAGAGHSVQQITASAPHSPQPKQAGDLSNRLRLPENGQPSIQFCMELELLLHRATWAGVQATKEALPAEVLQTIVLGVTPILSKEPTVVEVGCIS